MGLAISPYKTINVMMVGNLNEAERVVIDDLTFLGVDLQVYLKRDKN